MTYKFESNLYEILGNMSRNILGKPLNLGGYAGSGGGQGGPPGGFFGQLPQTRIAYDLSELSSNVIPTSGSLVDNLNHIRYRIDQIVGSGSGTNVDIKQDNILIAEDIEVIDFHNFFSVTPESPNGVAISLLSSGVMGDVTYSGVYGENLTAQIGGTHFDTTNTFFNGSLAVYLNGIRQDSGNYTLDSDHSGFTTVFTPLAGDTLTVDYVVPHSGQFHTHSQYALLDDVYTKEQINILLGYTNRTVNQQIIFTVAGSGHLNPGTLPIRLYAHDVNDGATISEIFCAFNTPPATEVQLNILKNGTTIFNAPSYVSITPGAYTAYRSTNFYDNQFVKDDYFQLAVVTGDLVASDLSVHIRFSYVLD